MKRIELTPSSKRTLVLLAIVILLGGARALTSWRSSQPRQLPANPLATIDRSVVSGVTLTRGSASVELVKKDGEWRVVGIDDTADASMVSTFLIDLIGASVTRVAATDTSALKPFYLDQDQALKVTLKDASGMSLADASLGAKDSSSAYLLPGGGSQVFEIDKNFASIVPTSDGWRSKMVLTLDTSAISEVEIRGKTSFVLRKVGQTHKLVTGGKESDVSEEKVNAYLTSLANLTAADFPNPTDAKGLDKPSSTIFIRSGNGPEIEVKVGGENALGDLYVKTNRRKTVFTVSAVDVKGLEQPDLKPDAPVSALPAPGASAEIAPPVAVPAAPAA